jgi:hypothetical protein
LSLVALIILVQNQTPAGRQSLLLVGGMVLATVYQLPLGFGMGLVWSAALIWKITDRLLEQDGWRLLVSSLIMSLVVGYVAHVQWSTLSSLFLVLNGVLSLLLIKITAIGSDRSTKRSL